MTIKAPMKEFIEAQPERKPDSDSVPRRLKMSDITGRKRGRSIGKDQQSAVVGQAEAPAATPSGVGQEWMVEYDSENAYHWKLNTGTASFWFESETLAKGLADAHNASLQPRDCAEEWTHEKLQGLLGISHEDRYVTDLNFENTLDEINAAIKSQT